MSRKPLKMKHPTGASGKADIFDSPAETPTPAAKPGKAQGYKKALVTLPVSDVAWIARSIESHRKNTRTRVSKSEVVRVGLELIRREGGLTEALKKIYSPHP
jgi:hypothetical protein